MSLLNILQFPDPLLKLKAEPVSDILAPEIQNTVRDMFETLYEIEGGMGLAAIQVNIQKCIIVIDVSLHRKEPLCLINPEITHQEGEILSEEGCLSFPGVYAKVKRAKRIEVSFYDQKNKMHQLKATDLLGVCIQHEIDHLNGITFYDHLSPLKQEMMRTKISKLRRKTL